MNSINMLRQDPSPGRERAPIAPGESLDDYILNSYTNLPEAEEPEK